jgi:serine kinase
MKFSAYAPPEIVAGTPYDPLKADIWSLGVILFIMLNAVMPFDDTKLRKLMADQKSRNYAFRDIVVDKLTIECINTVRLLLEPEPEKRCSIDQVLQSKWLKKHIEKDNMKKFKMEE